MNEQNAVYRESHIDEFRLNPLIEALPSPLEPDEIIRMLMTGSSYSDSDRLESTSVRMLLTQKIARFHQPMTWDVDIFERIDRSIRWGYADRNPLMSDYAAELAELGRIYASGDTLSSLYAYHPHTYGFSILGISGIGKTTTVENIMHFYPQVIHHSSYHGIPMIMDQIVWMKLDCSCDGSLKGICMDFFKSLDGMLGTSYEVQYRRSTLNGMLTAMSRLCATYSIGVLVIDEIQSLCSAAKDVPHRVLNFLVTLVNTIGVPVITIGTPKALSILQEEFQQAKRGSGQGDALWERMKEDQAWDVFCRALWAYQYTHEHVILSSEMSHALYEESQGIPFVAVHLYKLVQEDAILSGREHFKAKDIHSIASRKMKLTEPMRRAIKNGTEVDLKQYIDISSFSFTDYSDNYSVAAESEHPVRKSDVTDAGDIREDAIIRLMGMGLCHDKAAKFVSRTLADEKYTYTNAANVARQSFMDFLAADSENTVQAENPLGDVVGYDRVLQKGLIDEDV